MHPSLRLSRGHRCRWCHTSSAVWLETSRHRLLLLLLLLLSLQHILEVYHLQHQQLLCLGRGENGRVLLSPLLELSPALDIRGQTLSDMWADHFRRKGSCISIGDDPGVGLEQILRSHNTLWR